MFDFLITLFLGMFGVHKFMKGKAGMGFVYLFTCGLFGFGWMYDCIVSFVNIFTSKPAAPKRTVIYKQPVVEFSNSFRVAGMDYYRENFLPALRKNSPKYSDYVYKVHEDYATLVPEPTNSHDPNAIKVYMDKIHVGYVPAELTSIIKPMIGKKQFVITVSRGDVYNESFIEQRPFKGIVEVI